MVSHSDSLQEKTYKKFGQNDVRTERFLGTLPVLFMAHCYHGEVGGCFRQLLGGVLSLVLAHKGHL